MIWTILMLAIFAVVTFLVVRLVVRLVRRSRGQA
jgi:amino acid permease